MLIERIWRSQPGAYFCISTKSAGGKWRDHFFKRSELRQVAQFIEDNRDKDLYFCPHGFKRPRRLKPYAVPPKLMWSDMDEADPREVSIRPTVAIESSPGRFVGLWMTDREASESANRRLTYMIGADASGWDFTQVLRIPGTTNYKYPSLPRTRILWSDGPEYSLRDIEKQLPNEDDDTCEETDAAEVFKQWEKKIPHWARRELIHGKPRAGTRSEMIWKLEHTLLESGLTTDDAFVLIKSSPWNKFKGRRNEDEQLRRELDKAINEHFKAKKPVAESDGYTWLSTSLADVEEENLDWVWYPYLARGELTILEGDPDQGKSYLAQMVSGALVDGGTLPSPRPPNKDIQGRVAYFDLENSAGTVTKKRLVANGFENLKDYFQEEAPFSIDDEERVEEVYEALERIRPTLVVFDTLNTYIGRADAFKGHEAQQAFIKFKEIAKRFNCAVLVLRHLTKSTKERALYRGQGSIAFAGVARVVLTVGRMPDDDDTRVMAVTKLNLVRKPNALTFTIASLPDTAKDKDRSRFRWGDFVDLAADDILAAPTKSNGHDKKDAIDFLKDVLDDGEMEVTKVESAADKRSLSKRTVQRAADEIGVIRQTKGFGKNKRTYWTLP